MGGGLSGLGCALILKQNNIRFDLFEKRSCIGDRFLNCEIMLPVLTRPLENPINFFSEKYNIKLQPCSIIKKLIIHSQNNQANIEGNLGFTNLRGRADSSLEKQLQRQLDKKIFFNSQKSYPQLKKNYTHIVLATGDAAYADKLNNYKIELTVTLKGGIIKGNFNPEVVEAWLNNELAPKGYCYLIPLSSKQANIVIAFPDHRQKNNTDLLWQNFLQEISRYLDHKKIKVNHHFEVNKYIIGQCQQPKINNTFFTGNNFGGIMPFLGFGQVPALLTGIYAALDICGQGDYEQLTKPLRTSFHDSLALRQNLEKLNNNQYDSLVHFLKKFPGNKLVHLLFQSDKNYLKLISKFLKTLV